MKNIKSVTSILEIRKCILGHLGCMTYIRDSVTELRLQTKVASGDEPIMTTVVCILGCVGPSIAIF